MQAQWIHPWIQVRNDPPQSRIAEVPICQNVNPVPLSNRVLNNLVPAPHLVEAEKPPRGELSSSIQPPRFNDASISVS